MNFQKAVVEVFPSTEGAWSQTLLYLVLGAVVLITAKTLFNLNNGIIVGLDTVFREILPFAYIAYAFTMRESRALYYKSHLNVLFASGLIYTLSTITSISSGSPAWAQRLETAANAVSEGLLKGSLVAVVLNFA